MLRIQVSFILSFLILLGSMPSCVSCTGKSSVPHSEEGLKSGAKHHETNNVNGKNPDLLIASPGVNSSGSGSNNRGVNSGGTTGSKDHETKNVNEKNPDLLIASPDVSSSSSGNNNRGVNSGGTTGSSSISCAGGSGTNNGGTSSGGIIGNSSSSSGFSSSAFSVSSNTPVVSSGNDCSSSTAGSSSSDNGASRLANTNIVNQTNNISNGPVDCSANLVTDTPEKNDYPWQDYLRIEKVPGDGDCFFSAYVIGLEKLKPKENFNVEKLRNCCADALYKDKNFFASKVFKLSGLTQKDLYELGIQEQNKIESIFCIYLTGLRYSANDIKEIEKHDKPLFEQLTSAQYGTALIAPIWATLDIEGSILCKEYKNWLICFAQNDNKQYVAHKIGREHYDDYTIIDLDELDYNAPDTIYMLHTGSHYDALVKK